MTLTHTQRTGWTVDCPDCGGDGYTLGEPQRDTGWCNDVRCDECGGDGVVEPHPDYFDGGEFLLNGKVITVYSGGDDLWDGDNNAVSMADLRPVLALGCAA